MPLPFWPRRRSLVFAVSGVVSFEIERSASPASQSVTQGQNATYSVALDRGNKFSSAGRPFRSRDLPANAHGHVLSPSTIPGSGNASSMVVEDRRRLTTPTGQLPADDQWQRRRQVSPPQYVTLVVVSCGLMPNFSLPAELLPHAPSPRIDSGTYQISSSFATGGFNGPGRVHDRLAASPRASPPSFMPESGCGELSRRRRSPSRRTARRRAGVTRSSCQRDLGQPGSTVTREYDGPTPERRGEEAVLDRRDPLRGPCSQAAMSPFDLVLFRTRTTSRSTFSSWRWRWIRTAQRPPAIPRPELRCRADAERCLFPLSLPGPLHASTLSELGVAEADMPGCEDAQPPLRSIRIGCKGVAGLPSSHSGLATVK